MATSQHDVPLLLLPMLLQLLLRRPGFQDDQEAGSCDWWMAARTRTRRKKLRRRCHNQRHYPLALSVLKLSPQGWQADQDWTKEFQLNSAADGNICTFILSV